MLYKATQATFFNQNQSVPVPDPGGGGTGAAAPRFNFYLTFLTNSVNLMKG